MEEMIAESKPKTQKCIENALFDKHYQLIMSGFNITITLQPLAYGVTGDGGKSAKSMTRVPGGRREPIRDAWHKIDTLCWSGKRNSSPDTPHPRPRIASKEKTSRKKTSIFKKESSSPDIA